MEPELEAETSGGLRGEAAAGLEDYFSRQRAVPDWHQPLLDGQVALLLGVGGVGCSVARNLCRLGVQEVVLVDCDVVSASNINRQILFSASDVGRRKVEAAVEGLQPHSIRTKVTAFHCNAVKEWAKIVEVAQRSSVVFNGIDYGEYFDYAVTSLCAALSLPYISASSYGHSAIAECYLPLSQPQKGPCWGCNNAPADELILDKVTPNKILFLSSLDFLPKDSHMLVTQDVGSSILPCSLASTLATAAWANSIHGYDLPNWTSCNIASFEFFSYRVEPSPSCLICYHAPRYSSSVLDIYFGMEEVRLSQVPGHTLPYTPSTVTDVRTQVAIDSSQSHLKPWPGLKAGQPSCYVPAIPATELQLKEDLSSVLTSLPALLHNPLLKTQDGSIRAIQSGRRSAILPSHKCCYRLKGCGCFVDKDGMRCPYPGFPLEDMQAVEGGLEIKGCCFRHTAATEQYMSNYIAEALGSEGIVVGNKPIAVWRYTIPEEPVPQIGKYCGVFETLGECRLSSHLLTGLEALLPLLFPSLSLDTALDFFPPNRVREDKDGQRCVQPTWSACCTGGSTQCAPVDMCSTPLREVPPTQPPAGLGAQLMQEWCSAAYTLREACPLCDDYITRCGSLVALLYWHLGWEVGIVKRLLEVNGVNWGYFLDHNPFEPHCNSHPNNFIVLPPGHSTFLAPVDFDLSFTSDRFISPYSGTNDVSLFKSWLASENTEMERGLGGEEANTGLQDREGKHAVSPAHSALAWALRDTLLSGYRASYSGQRQLHPLPVSLRPATECLVHLSLIMNLAQLHS